ncbi:MAG TPA: hypothetical protein VEF06_08070 [Bryobacteraceae bacterium]|nr:hypothetical protein [Bryobacteraceae bacterium]
MPVVVLSVLLGGCVSGTKKAAKVVPPAVVPRAPARPAPPPVNAEAIANLPAPQAALPVIAQPALRTPNLPPPRPAAPRRQQPVEAQNPAPSAEPQPAPAPVAVPQLGEILTAAQRRQMQTEMADHLSRARDILTKASKVRLSSAQAETRERVRIFIQQAEDTRDRDPETALQLAKRADVLAQDLAPALH